MSLYYAILGLLGYQPMTGYDLKKLFDQSINNFWAAHISQIYRELTTMERQGHVESICEQQQDRPDKKIYHVTSEGRQAFRQWMEQAPEKLTRETRDEFSLRVFFGAELGKGALIELLERYLEQKKAQQAGAVPEIGRNIERYRKQFGNEGNVLYWKLIEKKVQMTNEMLIRWATESLEELKEENHEDQ